MRYVVTTPKSPEQAVADLEASAVDHQFGVLHKYDLKQTLASKGFDLPQACYILEVCNPRQAVQVLSQDIGMNIALPCRISVYEEDGHTKIGMIRPGALLESLSGEENLKEVAGEVEDTMKAIMEAAR